MQVVKKGTPLSVGIERHAHEAEQRILLVGEQHELLVGFAPGEPCLPKGKTVVEIGEIGLSEKHGFAAGYYNLNMGSGRNGC